MAEKDNQIKEHIKTLLPNYLQELGINDLKKNFNCLNPSHEDKHPSMSYNPNANKVKCFGCGVNWDIYDLYAVLEDNAPIDGTTVEYDFSKVLSELGQRYNVQGVPSYQPTPQSKKKNSKKALIAKTIENAQLHLGETDYLQKRGISIDLAKKFKLGYISEWKNTDIYVDDEAKFNKMPSSKRLIIPTSDYSYTARYIGEDKKQNRYMKVGKAHLFNSRALNQDTKPIFLVEGEFDALSILEASDKVEAIGLGSVSDQDIFINLLKKVKQHNSNYDPEFFIAMDNDGAGERANHQLEIKLNNNGFDNCHIVTSTLLNGHKDANEALLADKSKLTNNINKVLEDPDQYLANLLKRIANNQKEQLFIPTKFSNLDNVLDGGLYPQLYVLGAISSLGKTTFTLQIADNIARQKRKVFFFSLETSKDTLTEKILSRITFDTAQSDKNLMQTARSIENGYFMEVDENGNLKHPELNQHVMKAFGYYSLYYQYLTIMNGITKRPSAIDVYQKVKRYCLKHPDERPVVIVDYLQILRPIENGLTDKEAVTSSIAKLNELTEEFQCPVIVISSFNRQHYNEPVSMASFKESGEIEYYSDVLIGLQYQQGCSPDEQDFTNEDVLAPRQVEAKILKNRNGKSHNTVKFNFYNAFNEFIPDEN